MKRNAFTVIVTICLIIITVATLYCCVKLHKAEEQNDEIWSEVHDLYVQVNQLNQEVDKFVKAQTGSS